MKASNTFAANEARRAAAHQKLQRLNKTLRDCQRQRLPINVATVARLSGVSRTFLYENSEARGLVDDARSREYTDTPSTQQTSRRQSAAEATWRERALNAEARVRETHQEISRQRSVIADLMGKVREFEDADCPAEILLRVNQENADLRQHVLRLEAESRSLQQKLAAARENARFIDRKLADFEAEQLETIRASAPARPEAT